MAEYCPHCRQALNLTDGQRAKLQSELAKLPEGKVLKMKCPHCHQAIEFRADGSIIEHGQADITTTSSPTAPKPGGKLPTPPAPPDLDWLHTGQFIEEDIIEDVPKALILIPTAQLQNPVSHALREAGFQIIQPASDSDAIEKLQFEQFNIVVLHCSKGALQESVLHTHMCEMGMTKRRKIIYILIGPDYNTLYDLEALSCSANTVVNENEADKFGIIIKKARHDHEALFGPLLAVIKKLGK
jgi:sarcosine oxidase delta subunit